MHSNLRVKGKRIPLHFRISVVFKDQNSWTQTTQSALFISVLPGDYVLRDPAGGPRGMVRVMMKWKYPFQPSVDTVLGRQDRAMESTEREERRKEKAEASQRPIAKPRVKVILFILVCQKVEKLLISVLFVSKSVLTDKRQPSRKRNW